jgi:hypothetical protein
MIFLEGRLVWINKYLNDVRYVSMRLYLFHNTRFVIEIKEEKRMVNI